MAQPYGPPITTAQAQQAAAAALAEARKQGWTMAVAIVDPSGTLVRFEKIDDTQTGSVQVAIDKAQSAARFKRPTKSFQDTLAGGGVGLRVLAIQGAIAVEGGVPLVVGRSHRRRHRRIWGNVRTGRSVRGGRRRRARLAGGPHRSPSSCFNSLRSIGKRR